MDLQEQIQHYMDTRKPIKYTISRLINGKFIEVKTTAIDSIPIDVDNHKLRLGEVTHYRNHLLAEQNHTCALCNRLLPESDSVLDFHLGDGKIRSVLHRECRKFVRKIEFSAIDMNADYLHTILNNYVEYTTANYPDVFHPKTAISNKYK